MEMKATAVIQL